jgi:hypothetical protein
MAVTSKATKAIAGLGASRAAIGTGRRVRRVRRSRTAARTEPRRLGGALIAGGAAGAAGAYFLDPNNGRRRRHIARDRIGAFFRRGAAETQRRAEYVKGQAVGAAYEATRPVQPERPAPNDQALADRVRTEIFRPADAPKDSVNVNVEGGIVYLRGEVNRPEDIESLVSAAESVDGVRGVENLLHLPGTPAQTKGNRRKKAAASASQ